MKFKDYYKVLGLDRNATDAEIKRAYRKMARKFHPDVSKEPNAEERFKEVGEAYEVLKDPEKRASYNQLGENWKTGQDFRPPPDWDNSSQFYGGGFTQGDASQFSDFFESLFGGGRSRSARQGRQRGGFRVPGEDIHTSMEISLEDAFHGADRLIQLQMPEVNSHGSVVRQVKSIKVKIPAGVANGQQIRLKGQGGMGYGSEPGDLYIEIKIKKHHLYSLVERDIYLNLPITPWEAALGASVVAPTLKGKVDLKIPKGSQSGKKMRLKGQGLPGKNPGDFYVILVIHTPPADTETAQKLYHEMAKTLPFNPRADLGV